MGGGGLRILGHKTWHVWKRENIEKVRRDERIHKEKEEKEKKKKRKLEQEERIGKLMKLSKKGEQMETNKKHINFFEAEAAHAANMEYEKEKREKEHKELERMGVAPVALGGNLGSSDRNNLAGPWYSYSKGHIPIVDKQGKVMDPQSVEKMSSKHTRHKDSLDPMLKMSRYLRQTSHKEQAKSSSTFGYETVHSMKSNFFSLPGERRSTKSKDHVPLSEAVVGKCRNSSREQLRQARLAREVKERERRAILLGRLANN